jgi:hypothetical protein
MLRAIDEFYLGKTEPNRSCLFALRDFITHLHPDITEEWKYKMPFFYLKGKMFCYLWMNKKSEQPYIGVVRGSQIEHPDLVYEKTTYVKILYIDPKKNIPIRKLNAILKKAVSLY